MNAAHALLFAICLFDVLAFFRSLHAGEEGWAQVFAVAASAVLFLGLVR